VAEIQPSRGLRRRADADEPAADVHRGDPRRDHRRASGPGRRQRRRHPAAAHLQHGADPGGATSAIILLSCIYWGALFGGAITSILFNIPGEPWSVATTFDGYPLAQQGRAGNALTAAFTSSFVGALVAVILITFLSPVIANFALEFGPPEFFAVYLLTFCAFIGTSKEPPFKTLAAMMLGFALAAVGTDPVTGTLRLTFGSTSCSRASTSWWR
jgi:hypothetical protein